MTPVTTTRQSASKRGYNYKWVAARETFLRAHPLCAYCYKAGYVEAATVVDHIIPHKGNQHLFWDSQNNWQALCKKCHDKVKAKEEHDAGYRL